MQPQLGMHGRWQSQRATWQSARPFGNIPEDDRAIRPDLCDLFTRMAGLLLGACVHFDTGDDPRIDQGL